MKKYEFDLNKPELELFFPHHRIKSKISVLEILMEATRFMLNSYNSKKKNAVGKIILLVDKMSRLFFFKKDKYYSITFPFYVTENNGKIFFSLKNKIDVDAQMISNVFTVLNDSTFNSDFSIDFIDPIYHIEENINVNFWEFFKELLLLEDGYIRYDEDEENYLLAKEKGEENKHPLHHFDIFYSSNATLKIGLENKFVESEFIDILDVNKDCEFIKK